VVEEVCEGRWEKERRGKRMRQKRNYGRLILPSAITLYGVVLFQKPFDLNSCV
jgi:hypothetical protein